jgi:hypothetical protein
MRSDRLSFAPEDVGSHWSADAQACTERSERVTLVPLAQLDGTLRAAADL